MRGTAYLPRSRFTERSLVGWTSLARRKPRLRLADFFSSRWLCGPFRRRSLPVPVTLNRFFAPLCVFCFGIVFLHSCVLRRPQDHHHVASVEERRRLDLPDLLHVLRQPHQQVPPSLRLGGLPPAKHDRHLHLRALVEEALDVVLLGVVVVDSDLGPELDLLDVDRDLVLARELRLLLLLVAVLAVVHHPRYRRIRLRRHLDEVEVLAPRVLARLVRVLDPDLLAVVVDQPDLRRADHLVDSGLRDRRPVRLDRPSWSQRPFTKFSVPPSRTTKPLPGSGPDLSTVRLNLREAARLGR